MCQSTASSPGAGHKGFCGHMRSAGHKLKKAGRRLRDKLAKHGLLGANFKSDYELGELGRKYWTRPEQVDEETYRNSVRAPGSTWWHNCDRKDDSCHVAMAKYPRLSHEPTIYRDAGQRDIIDKYYHRNEKKPWKFT